MQLPFLRKNQVSAVEHEYLLALEISPGVIKSAVWSVINGLTQVVSIGRAQPWNNSSLADLIAATDASLSEACARVDESGKLAINRVIFGLQSDWLETDKIKPDKLDWLKQLSQKLAFTLTAERQPVTCSELSQVLTGREFGWRASTAGRVGDKTMAADQQS